MLLNGSNKIVQEKRSNLLQDTGRTIREVTITTHYKYLLPIIENGFVGRYLPSELQNREHLILYCEDKTENFFTLQLRCKLQERQN